MFHEFRQKICDVVDRLSNRLPIVESCRDEEKKTVPSLSSQMCDLHECVDSTFGDLAKRLENLEVAGCRAETTLESLLPLIAKIHSLQQEVTCLCEESHHSHGCDLSCSCRSSISLVRREVSEVKLDITKLFASLETMHSAHDCDETCSCRVAISMVEHELVQMRGEGTRLSSSLDELHSQITRVQLDMDSVSRKAGVHMAHGPHCSINCSCRMDIARHKAEVQRIGLALDELRDCLDSVVNSVGWSDHFLLFASDLASMHSQLDAHFSLSSQSFATLQSKVAALEEVYETWTAGDAGVEEEEDETDDDNYDHKGVCFHTGEPQYEEEVPAKARRSTTRWDGVAKGLPSEDPFADLNWVKGNSFTSAMHSGLHTLDATQVGAVGKGGRPIPSLFHDTSKEATFEMPGIPQASVDFPSADFLSAVSQDKSTSEQEPKVKLRGIFGKTGTDRPDVEALDDEIRRGVMKILKRPSWDGKQVSRPIFQRQWQGFHGYWFKRCASDTMAKILLTALPESSRTLYTQLHLFLGWTYKDIWEDIMKPIKNVSRRMYRKKWRKSLPSQKKALEAYESWVLEWTLSAQQAAPVTPLEAKEAFTAALHRHGGYQDELNELYKYEELKGVELLHQGAHQLIQYELTWRSTRKWPSRLIKGRQMQTCGRCAVGEQTGIRVTDHAQHPLIFPKFPGTSACIAAIRDIGPRTAELSRRI